MRSNAAVALWEASSSLAALAARSRPDGSKFEKLELFMGFVEEEEEDSDSEEEEVEEDSGGVWLVEFRLLRPPNMLVVYGWIGTFLQKKNG